MAVQKMQAVVQKIQVRRSFSSERYVLNKRPMGDMLAELCIQTQGKAAMERCALCHGKLGLGTASVIYGTAVVGFMFAFVRFVAKAFMRSNETTPPNNAGTASWLAASCGAECLLSSRSSREQK